MTACFPYQREVVHWEPKKKKISERGGKTELSQWHLSVLNWHKAGLVGEERSLPDVIAEDRER